MISLSIRDFQAIHNALLEFEPGITIITGSTMSGKTAIMRSMQCLLTNPTYGKHCISYDQKSSEVSLSIEGQPTVKWLRTPTQINYIIGDGKTNEKCGKADLWSFLPNYPIQVEPDGRIVNLHTEYDILFPFGYTPQELFKVFERVMALDDTASVLKAINEDLNRVTMLRRHCKVSIENKRAIVETETLALEELASANTSERDLLVNLLLAINEQINRVHQEAIQFEELNKLLRSLSPSISLLSSIFIPSRKEKDQKIFNEGYLRDRECEGKGFEELTNTKQIMQPPAIGKRTSSGSQQLASDHDDLSLVQDFTSCDSTLHSDIKELVNNAERSFRTVAGVYKAVVALFDCNKSIEVLSNLPDSSQVNLGPLEASIRGAGHVVGLLNGYLRLQSLISIISEVPDRPEILPVGRYEEVVSYIKKIEYLLDIINKRDSIDDKIVELTECLAFLNEEIDKYDNCEVCGAPISGGKFRP